MSPELRASCPDGATVGIEWLLSGEGVRSRWVQRLRPGYETESGDHALTELTEIGGSPTGQGMQRQRAGVTLRRKRLGSLREVVALRDRVRLSCPARLTEDREPIGRKEGQFC